MEIIDARLTAKTKFMFKSTNTQGNLFAEKVVGFSQDFYKDRDMERQNDIQNRENRSCGKGDEEVWYKCTGHEREQMGWFWANAYTNTRSSALLRKRR